jgi:hypothetical protein
VPSREVGYGRLRKFWRPEYHGRISPNRPHIPHSPLFTANRMYNVYKHHRRRAVRHKSDTGDARDIRWFGCSIAPEILPPRVPHITRRLPIPLYPPLSTGTIYDIYPECMSCTRRSKISLPGKVDFAPKFSRKISFLGLRPLTRPLSQTQLAKLGTPPSIVDIRKYDPNNI